MAALLPTREEESTNPLQRGALRRGTRSGRAGERHEDPEIEFDPEIQVVKSLDEAAMVVNVMANGLLKR